MARAFAIAAVSLGVLAGCADDPFLTSDVAGLSAPAGFAATDAPSGVVYALPTARVPVRLERLVGSDGAAELRLTLGTPIFMPDPEHTYTLVYDHDGFSSDEITVKTSADGLLEFVGTTTSDERRAFLTNLASLATEIAKGLTPLGPLAAAPLPLSFERDVQTFEVEFLVDPTDADFEARALAALESIGVSDVALKIRTEGGETRTRDEIAAYCSVGACYRRAAPISIEATDFTAGVVVSNTILLPNNGVVGRLDFQRRPFVKNQAQASFVRGMLIDVKYVDPSSAAAAANAPLDAVRSIVALPTALYQSETDTLEAEKALLDARAALLRERTELLDAEQRYRDAVAAGSTPAP